MLEGRKGKGGRGGRKGREEGEGGRVGGRGGRKGRERGERKREESDGRGGSGGKEEGRGGREGRKEREGKEGEGWIEEEERRVKAHGALAHINEPIRSLHLASEQEVKPKYLDSHQLSAIIMSCMLWHICTVIALEQYFHV